MAVGWVADYTPRIAPSVLRAAGIVGVCRYLAPITANTAWKRITLNEYLELTAAGTEVLLNWEYDARDWLGGASAGTTHGQLAASQAIGLGYPIDRVIVGSADFDMTIDQWRSSGRAYAEAFRNALRVAGYGAGVYGPWDVLTWCSQLGGFRVFWQAGMSTAWSGGRNARLWSGAHLRQRRQVTVGGVQVDQNDIVQADWSGGGAMASGFRVFQVEGHTWLYLSDGTTRRLITNPDQFFNWVDNHGWPVLAAREPTTVSVANLDTLAGYCTAGPDPASTGTMDDVRSQFAGVLTITPDQLIALEESFGTVFTSVLRQVGVTVQLTVPPAA